MLSVVMLTFAVKVVIPEPSLRLSVFLVIGHFKLKKSISKLFVTFS